MEYKGYTALIQYSTEDGCFIGKVIGISDQIIFDATSLDEICKTFEADVDSYLQYCQEKGREPNKPVFGNHGSRFPGAVCQSVP